MKSQNRMFWISSMNLHQRKTRKDLFLICHFWKSSVERNKSISQKISLPQNFSAPPKDLSINYLSNSSYSVHIKTKKGTCKKNSDRLVNIWTSNNLGPKFAQKKKNEWKKINISRTLMSKEILQKRYNYSASNIFFHFFRTKHKCSHNQPKHNQ